MPPKRRRRFQGLYYHSSPPKVMPMNGQISSQNGRKRRDMDDFSVKLSTIRIWMHEKDIGKLTRILWAGQGNRLSQQASTNHKVKRFLAAVPCVMNSIKDVHQAVIDNNLETLQAKLEPPVPPALMTCKDANGLNIVHKAAGLGHTMILEYLIGAWPEGANETDITGKTPLHWAASAKNNMRCYTLLTQAGCDEEALDYKMKTPTYYRHKPNEIERAFLVYVPEAPRVSPDVVTDWEALSGEDTTGGGDSKKLDLKKVQPTTNGFHGRSHDDSIENTSEVDLNDGVSAAEEEEIAKDDEMAPALIENGNKSQSTPPETPEEKHEDENAEDTQAAADEENNSNDLNETTTSTTETEASEKVEDNPEEANNSQEKKESEINGKGEDSEDDSNKKESVEEYEHKDEIASKEGNIEENKESHEEEGNSEENYEAEIEDENNKEPEDNDNTEITAVTASNNNNNDTDESMNENIIKNTNNDEEVETSEIQIEQEENNDEIQANDKTEEDVINNAKEIVIDEVKAQNENEVEILKDDEENDEAEIESENNKEIIMDETEAQNENEVELLKHDNNDKIINQDQETGEKICIKKSAEKDEVNTEEKKELNNETDDKKQEEEEEEVQKEKEDHNENKKVATKDEDADDAEEDDDENVIVPPAASNAEDGNDDDDEDNDDVVEAVPDSDDERLDENHNNEGKYDAVSGSSPTSSLAIEGFVEGVPEDNTVQSQSAAYVDEEPRLQEIISSGDIGQLAQIVLNGEGKKLLNTQSTEPEVQEFLNNVPRYMSQIRRVHEAARESNLTVFRQALERRKFAISKDEVSPNGATPLHVAVLFGNTEIVRYLAEKFPEAITITDNDGRTALHYAATIKDNGHFYNMLTQSGGNAKALDKLGHTPEFYLNDEQSKNILSYRQLLSNFGAEELEEELLSDQGQAENSSYQSNPIFKTEQGKYLASNLADPLIKALTEIASKRPEDPVSFLTNFLQNYIRLRNPKAKQLNSSSSKTNSTTVMNSESSSVRKNNNRNANLTNSNNDEIEEDRNSVGEEEEEEEVPITDDRDEHGQSMLHFACARSHRRGGLMHLIEESNMDITYRDELYRTARDVSLQANQPANAKDIDRYVLSLVSVGDLRPFEHFVISGYDHIIDVNDDNGNSITDIAAERGHEELADFLRNLRSLEELREELHQMIRNNNVGRIKEITAASNAQWFLKAKNYYGRTALHIAILKESEEITEHFVKICPETLKIGDNLERTALHYAMGTNAIEGLSRILIQNGAKRTTKDLKGRQPSYYFMNKADILRLQEEEDENR